MAIVDSAPVVKVLRKHQLWADIQSYVRMLKAKGEIGQALSEDGKHRLVAACNMSRTRSLYPAVLLSLLTGPIYGGLRMLRWRRVRSRFNWWTRVESNHQPVD